MTSLTVLILVLLVGTYLLDLLVETLNLRHLSLTVPPEFQALYDPEKYRKALSYQATSTRFDLLRRSVSLATLLVFIFAGGFDWVDRMARSVSANPLLTGLVFVGLLSFLRSLLSLPFALYDTFVIEERFGFNRTTARTFITDLVKSTLLGALIGAPLLAAILAFFENAGSQAWLYSWAFLTVAQLVLAFIAPALILPLFNRFDPLPDGELKQAVQRYASDHRFQLSGVYRMDSSKRSTKTNAFFTGFGRFRRLVLFDTLIEKHTPEELVGVVAHEIGHFKRGHIPKSIALSVLSSGALFYALSLLMKNRELFDFFRVRELSVHASLVFAGLLFSPVMRWLSILTTALSRKFEYEADEFATRTTGDPQALASALMKLSVDNLSNLTPHPFKVALDYTHPPVLERIRALRGTR